MSTQTQTPDAQDRAETQCEAERLEYLTEADTCSEADIFEAVQGFLTGDLTLAQLEGLSADDLYQVADLGYVHLALGSIYQRLGMLEESFNHYESAVQLYAEDIVAWTNLGEVALDLATRLVSPDPEAAARRFEQAVEALSTAIALDGDGRHPSGLRARALVAAAASAA
jgi:tetratricopeptide (TPR) repeat protein